MLKNVLKNVERIRYVQHIDEEGEQLFGMVATPGLEGIVAKNGGAPYPRGRTRDWLKIKDDRRAGR